MQAVRRILVVLLLWLAPGLTGPALAQSSAPADGTSTRFTAREVADFAKQVERAVAAHGARVFIVARKGRAVNELPRGIEYTHTALGVYSSITLDDGRTVPGYAMYNLYQRLDRLDESRIVIDYPAEFFAGAFALEAAVIIPVPTLQARLLEAIDDGWFHALHNPRYSAISNPFDARFQNCTEHLLDFINAAIYQSTDPVRLKRYAHDWFTPQRVNVGAFRLLLGGLFKDEVAIADHKGAAYTATFGSIRDYLASNGMIETTMLVDARNPAVVE